MRRNLTTESFRGNLKIMRALGIYPPLKNYRTIYRMYSCLIYFFCIVPVPTLTTVYLSLNKNMDIIKFADNMFQMIQFGCFIFKFIPFFTRPAKIRKSLHMLRQPIFNKFNDKQDKEIIQECIWVCKRNFYLFYGSAIASLFTWAVSPIFKKGRSFPIDVWTPFDPYAKKYIYIPIYIHIVVGIVVGAINCVAVDPLIGGLIYHATAQIKILKDNLQDLGEFVEQTPDNNALLVKQEAVYSRIVECIEHHNAILRFVKVIEDNYASVAFPQLVASVVVICISCFELMIVDPMTWSFFQMICYVCTMLTEIYLYCYYGTTLYNESNSLRDAIHMGKWYDYDLISRRALIILIERSKKPMVVTSGKILDLSLETFATILRRAYSLLAVLKNYTQ